MNGATTSPAVRYWAITQVTQDGAAWNRAKTYQRHYRTSLDAIEAARTTIAHYLAHECLYRPSGIDEQEQRSYLSFSVTVERSDYSSVKCVRYIAQWDREAQRWTIDIP